jgi:hypothetical protein
MADAVFKATGSTGCILRNCFADGPDKLLTTSL